MFRKIFKCYSTSNPKLATQLFINGNFVNSSKGTRIQVFNPATEKLITEIQEATEVDVDKAVISARNAFDNGPWRKMNATERGRLLFKLADLIEKEADSLAFIESIDTGKPLRYARLGDVNGCINMMRYYAGFADKIHGQTIDVDGPYNCYTRHEPVGVCAQIIPWNFPIAGLASKIAPALASGCTVVLKPAELTPLSALKVGELIAQAGIPEGVVNIVPGYGKTAGETLIRHPLVDKVSFTGSTEVGIHIMKNCHGNHLKRVSLELGGKNPNIVMDDANVDMAVKLAHGGVFYNSGQICVAGSRLFVHEKIYDEFVEKSVELAKKRKIGDPLDPQTEQGPVVDSKQRERYLHYVKKGIEEGADIRTGGSALDGKGYFVQPTVFTNVKDEMTIAKEEIFAPIMSIMKFKTVEEVIKRANNTQYGLASGVMTSNIETAMKISNSLKAGTVWINCYGVFGSNVPYGGYKNSGIGREHGKSGLDNYTEIKTVIIKRPEN